MKSFFAKATMGRCLPYLVFAMLLAFTHTTDATVIGQKSYTSEVKPLLQQYCFTCHGEDTQEAGIRYDLIQGFSSADVQLWTRVNEKLLRGEMPPKGELQPSANEKKKIQTWIHEQALGARKIDAAGGVRRLNRRELANSLSELLGLDIDLSIGLPEDGLTDGFDTGARQLHDTAASVETTLDVIHKAVSSLRILDPPAEDRRLITVDLSDGKPLRDQVGDFDKTKIKVDVGREVPVYGGVLRGTYRAGKGRWPSVYMRNVENGLVRIRFELTANTPNGLSAPWLCTSYSGVSGRTGPVGQEHHQITGTLDDPQTVEKLWFIEDIVVHKRQHTWGLEQWVEFPFRHHVELPYVMEENKKLNDSQPDLKYPWIFVRGLEVEYPYQPHWRGLEGLGPIADDEASANKVIGKFVTRAFRRPVDSGELEPFLRFYRSRRESGASFDEAIRNVMEMVLISGRFRFLAAVDGKDRVHDQYAIASRLSYFFWSNMPDGELLTLAAEGKLTDLKTLDAQVDRMLADSRAEEFLTAFTTMWLELKQPIQVAYEGRDPRHKYKGYLIESLRQETIAYHQELLRENLPARALIDSDFAMMNDTTADFYGYPRLSQSSFSKVKLRNDDPRGGGLFGHAGIVSMTAFNGVTRPMFRGAWALRTVLDDPPPAPPLEVPDLDPNAGANRGKSMRELLAQHQEDARCAICHKTMDPLGFAFQNFDISGRWRELEYHQYEISQANEAAELQFKGKGDSRPVDCTGQLPRGETFSSFAEMKSLVAENYLDDVVRGYLKRLVLYGVGRSPDVIDMQEIRQIMERQRPKSYPLRDLLKEFIRSRAFLNRQQAIERDT